MLGLLIGFVGLLAAVGYYPIAAHERVESLSTVAINGGRSEAFVVRLPVDRIATVGEESMLPRSLSHPGDLHLPSEFAGVDLLVEHFKLRNLEGTVIGLATRHATANSGGVAISWLVDVPGRGTLVFAGEGVQEDTVAGALRTAGYRPGVNWKGELTTGPLLDAAQTRVVSGTREFADVEGQYQETWQITGVSAEGELQGTIEFNTVVNGRRK